MEVVIHVFIEGLDESNVFGATRRWGTCWSGLDGVDVHVVGVLVASPGIFVHVRRGTWQIHVLGVPVRYLTNPTRRGTLVEAELDEIHMEVAVRGRAHVDVQHDGLGNIKTASGMPQPR